MLYECSVGISSLVPPPILPRPVVPTWARPVPCPSCRGRRRRRGRGRRCVRPAEADSADVGARRWRHCCTRTLQGS
eukprot:6410200-Alexandrium_andersonii.AAC.1